MADSWFPAEPPVSPDAAYGYELDEEGSPEREEPQVFTLQSAGGLWSTGPDLVRFGAGWRTLLPLCPVLALNAELVRSAT